MKSIADADRKAGKHVFSLDLIRAVAIIMVVADHGVFLPPFWRNLLLVAVGSAAMLFMVLSGALLLPVEGSYKAFLIRRVKRVFIPYLFWFAVLTLALMAQGEIDGTYGCFMLRWGWLTPYYGYHWFIFAILGLYLFMPIISPWIASASRRHIEYYLLIWAAAGLVPFFHGFMGMKLDSNYFFLFANYMGYCVLGYYLVRYPVSFKDNKIAATITFAFAAVVPILCCLIPGRTIDWLHISLENLSIAQFAQCALIFALLLRVKTLGRFFDPIVRILSRDSYGIYLIHIVIGRTIVNRYFPELSETSWMLLIYLFGSLIVCEILRRIPWIRVVSC